MLFNLSDAGQWENLLSRLDKLHSKGAWIEVKEKAARTTAQNKYLHAVFGYFGANMGYKREYVKEHFFKRAANSDLFLVERTDKKGHIYQDTRSTSDLSKEEMQIAIERFRNWAAMDAGVYIPSADDWKSVLMMEKIAEENRDYL